MRLKNPHSMWSETGVDLGAEGRIVDHGDIQFDDASDPWDLIEQNVTRAMDSGDALICLGGDHAITHPIMRAVSQRHSKLTKGNCGHDGEDSPAVTAACELQLSVTSCASS